MEADKMALGRKTGGRKKGSLNKVTAAQRAEIVASGETPLDYMLRVMRDPSVEHTRRDEMAKAAAPYVHSRLASVDHSGGIDLGLGARLEAAIRRMQADEKAHANGKERAAGYPPRPN
jgi:hypothetical protein